MKPFNLVSRLALMALIAAIGIGCQKEGPVESLDRPAAKQPAIQANQSSSQGSLSLTQSTEPSIISVTERVTYKRGGVLKLTYNGGTGDDRVKVTIQFKVPPKSVSRDCDITMGLDANKLLTDINIVDLGFEPSGISFSKPASLSVQGKGLNLAGLPANAKPTFYYWDEDTNEWVPISFKRSSVNIDLGMIDLDDGEVPHFSRYAFGF